MTSLYDVLGVTAPASAAEIRAAFRKKAMENHPDCGGSHEEFCRIQLAYEVLSDDTRRLTYDHTGEIQQTVRDREVEQRIREVFEALLDKDQIGYNAVKQAIQWVDDVIEKNQVDIKKLEKQLKKLAHRKRRIFRRARSQEQTNLFLDIAEAKIGQCQQQVNRLNNEIDICRDVVRVLEEYEDYSPGEPWTPSEEQPNRPRFVVPTTTSYGTTSSGGF